MPVPGAVATAADRVRVTETFLNEEVVEEADREEALLQRGVGAAGGYDTTISMSVEGRVANMDLSLCVSVAGDLSRAAVRGYLGQPALRLNAERLRGAQARELHVLGSYDGRP